MPNNVLEHSVTENTTRNHQNLELSGNKRKSLLPCVFCCPDVGVDNCVRLIVWALAFRLPWLQCDCWIFFDSKTTTANGPAESKTFKKQL